MATSTPLAELLAKARAAQELKKLQQVKSSTLPGVHVNISKVHEAISQQESELTASLLPHAQFSGDIQLNSKQQEFMNLVLSGADCVLIGAAGTGKTTCIKAVIAALAQKAGAVQLEGVHKYLPIGTPSVVLTSFTRRAVNNLKRAVSADFEDNCITIHKLLEYQPEYYEVFDPETGEDKKTMRFVPSRSSRNPLDSSIKTLVIDEASMVSLELEEEINVACPHHVQKIYLGDINQLTPVFGSAVLGYRMQELPVIELTEIYRQAANSPIIKYATAIKDGETFSFKTKHVEQTEDGKITFHPWKKQLRGEDALATAAAFLKQAIDLGAYDPEEHMVLCPFNKSFGTLELNKNIANHLARKRGATTYEVIAGFLFHYFSPGDRVMYDKEDAIIVSINKNASYTGTKKPKPASPTLDYWGCEQGSEDAILAAREVTAANELGLTEEDVEKMLSEMSSSSDGEARVTAASHIITVQMIDSGEEVTLETASEVNSMLHGYALTVHKSQGAEWEKVFVMLHQSHATMLQRELLYTALTRARSEVYVICEPDTFTKGVLSQKIKGNTLAEKAEFFKGRINKLNY
jgi:exodeoxyribonuclease V alpha subunit